MEDSGTCSFIIKAENLNVNKIEVLKAQKSLSKVKLIVKWLEKISLIYWVSIYATTTVEIPIML